MRRFALVIACLALLPCCNHDEDQATAGGTLDQLRVEATATVTADRRPIMGPAPPDVTIVVDVTAVNPLPVPTEVVSAEAVILRASTGQVRWRAPYERLCVDLVPPCPLMTVPAEGSATDSWSGKVPELPVGSCGERLRVDLMLRGAASVSRTVDLGTVTLACVH